MKVTVTLDIDFRLFKQQKEQLLTILNDDSNKDAVESYSNLDGIIHTIDEIQDQASEQLSEEIVFGTPPSEETQEEKEKAFRDAERPEKIIGTREDRMRTFGAYQHFLYYFDQALYEKEQPHGGMTHHFLRKLEMFRKIHSPEGCNTIKVLVEWVQGMTSNNQEDLLNWILKHHSDKW